MSHAPSTRAIRERESPGITSTLCKQSKMAEGEGDMSQLIRLWYLSHRRPAKAQASLRIRAVSPELRCSHTWTMEGLTKNRTSEWLRMHGWMMSLRRTKSAIISWAGSIMSSSTLPSTEDKSDKMIVSSSHFVSNMWQDKVGKGWHGVFSTLHRWDRINWINEK